MKHTGTTQETKLVTIVTREWLTCDICKAEIKKKDLFDLFKAEARMRIGTSFPDGGNYTEYRIDMCEYCFENRLTPWLQSLGVELSTEESQW